MLVGSEQPEVTKLRAQLTEPGGDGASLYARGLPSTDPRTAALLNGIAGRTVELCETHRYVSCQGAVQVLPTVLALGEAGGRGGREALAALVLGDEVAARSGGGPTARRLAPPNGPCYL